jgi:hypothetical protein
MRAEAVARDIRVFWVEKNDGTSAKDGVWAADVFARILRDA